MILRQTQRRKKGMVTVGNVVNWERLRGKRFADFDGENADDVITLGYVCNGTRDYTLALYRDALLNSGIKELEAVARKATAEFAYLAQFATPGGETSTPEGEKAAEATEKAENESITEIVGTLIMGGVDGDFLLSRGLEDLRWLSEAYHRESQRRMEFNRYWAYVQLSPWIDKTKAHNPGEFLPFEWEKAAGGNPSVITELETKVAAALFGDRIKETPGEKPGGETAGTVAGEDAEAVTYQTYDGTIIE